MGTELSIIKQKIDLTYENTKKEQSQQQILSRMQMTQKILEQTYTQLGCIVQASEDQLIISEQNIDKRIKIISHQFPHSLIGRVQLAYKNGKAYGTGCLIGHNVVLTAAHNIHDRETREFAKWVFFSLKKGNQRFKRYQVIYLYVPKQFINEKNDKTAKEHDYAILILNTQGQYLGKQYGTLSLQKNITFQQCRQNIIQVYGYPDDRNKMEGNKTSQNQYGCSGKIKQISDNFICHLVDTNHGQSGAPILIKVKQSNKTVYKIIGIHIKGVKMYRHNIGVKITDRLIKKINQWIQNLKEANQNYIKVPEYFLKEEEQFNNYQIEKCLKYQHTKSLILDEKNIIKMSCIEWNKSSHRVSQNELVNQSIQKDISEIIPQNQKSPTKLIVRNTLKDDHISYILEAISLTAITQIDLANNLITSQGIKAFTQFYNVESNFHYNQFSSLKKLAFSNNPIKNKGFLYLMNPQIFPKLEELRIQNCQFGSLEGNQSTFKQIKLLIVRLKILNMNSNRIIYQDIIKLFDCKSLKQFKMQQLNISSNNIQGKSLEVLGLQAFFHLKKLRIANNKMSLKTEDIKKIGINPFPKLELLSLWGNELTKQSINLIMELQIFRNVSTLSLDDNEIGNDGLQFLANKLETQFPKLIKLDISKCGVSERGIDYLINKKNYLSELRQLFANFNKFQNKQNIKQNIKKKLREAFKRAYIQVY